MITAVTVCYIYLFMFEKYYKLLYEVIVSIKNGDKKKKIKLMKLILEHNIRLLFILR